MTGRAVFGILTLIFVSTSTLQANTWWAEMSCYCDADGDGQAEKHTYRAEPEHGSLGAAISNAVGQLEAECMEAGGCEGVPKLEKYGQAPPIKRESSESHSDSLSRSNYTVRVCMRDGCQWIQFDVEGVADCCCQAKYQVHEILRQLTAGGACFHYCVIKNCCDGIVQVERRGILGSRRR